MQNNLLDNKIFIKLKTTGDRNNQKQPLGVGSKKEHGSTFNELKDYPNIGMVIPKGYVVIDVDDNSDSEKVLRYVNSKKLKCVVSKTGNGAHFLFKKNNHSFSQTSHQLTHSLINVDTKIGGKNGQVAVRFRPDAEVIGDGIGMRLQNFSIPLNDLDELPLFLTPLKFPSKLIKEIASNKGLEGSRDEDTKNITISFGKDRIKNKKQMYELIGDINMFLMDKPHFRSQPELIGKVDGGIEGAENHKDEKFRPEEIDIKNEEQEWEVYGLDGNKSRINYIQLAQHITFTKKLVFYDKSFYIKNNLPGHKIIDEDELWADIILYVGNKIFAADRTKLFEALKAIARKLKTDDSKDFVNVKNGRFNTDTALLQPYSKELFLTDGINVDYKENTRRNAVDKALDVGTSGIKDNKQSLLDGMGSTFYPDNSKAQMLILGGPSAGNGKSTFQKMFMNFRGGYDAVISLNLTQIESKFGLASAMGKKVIMIDELEDSYLEKVNNLKTLITGGPLEIEPKFKMNFTHLSTGKIIGSTNRFPRVNDDTDGFGRRMSIVEFKWKYNKKENYEFEETDLFTREAYERLLYLTMKGLINYRKEGGIRESQNSKEVKKKIREENNPVLQGSKDKETVYKKTIHSTLSENYSIYKSWCSENTYKPLGKIKFGQELDRTRPDLYGKESKASSKILMRVAKVVDKEALFEDFVNNLQEDKKPI